MNDNEFRLLLSFLNLSWGGYKKVRKGVKKRIRRHMQQLGAPTVEDYLNLLGSNSEAKNACELLMMVTISRFFRDRQLWESLKRVLIPAMLAVFKDRIWVWSAGCASGEEAYSFRIIWEHVKQRYEKIPELNILASDANPACLERGEKGIFPKSSLREVPDEIQTSFFKPGRKNQHAIREDMKRGIEFKRHILLSEPPLKTAQIVFLRNNLLTYYQEPIKNSVLDRILDCLAPQGLLITGAHENVPFIGEKLAPCVPMVFRKYGKGHGDK